MSKCITNRTIKQGKENREEIILEEIPETDKNHRLKSYGFLTLNIV